MKRTISLENLLEFQKFLDELRSIKRHIYYEDAAGGEVREDDQQHSFHTAMLAWFLLADNKNLNVDKVIKLALVHDLVEVYAGDEMALGRTEVQAKAKKEREAAALEKIKTKFNNFSELSALMKEYEDQESAEAIFAYQVDKLAPVLTNITQNGLTWKKLNLQKDFVISEKDKRIKVDSPIYHVWQECRKELLSHPEMFPEN